MKLARKTDESASDVVGYGMVTRCHQHCGGATDQYIDRAVDILMVRGRWYVFLKMVISILSRGLCVPEVCDVRIELIPWMARQPLKHVPNGREERKQPGIGTQGPMKQPRLDPRTHDKRA